MKSNVFISIFILIFLSCQPDFRVVINSKVNYMDSGGFEFFNGYKILPIRKIKDTSYDVNRIPYDSDYAIIRIHPDTKIEKNFRTDTVDISFVKEFKKLDCRYLYCAGGHARIDFNINKRIKITLFKGNNLPKHHEYLNSARKVTEFKNEWKYIVLERH